MVLTNPTGKEEKEFKNLQEKGMLPSEALERLETERKLGIISPEASSLYDLKQNWWFYLGAGSIAIAILYIYIKSAQIPAVKPAYNQPKISDEYLKQLKSNEEEIIRLKNELYNINNIKQQNSSDEYQEQLKMNQEKINIMKKELQLTNEQVKQSIKKTLNLNNKHYPSIITFNML